MLAARAPEIVSQPKLGAEACTAEPLPKDETEATVIDLLQREVLSPRYLRAESLFMPGDGGLPWADSVEALLDLYELRLIEQADDLFRRMRPGASGYFSQ